MSSPASQSTAPVAALEAARPPARSPFAPSWHMVGLAGGLVVFAIAAIVLFRTLENVSWQDLKASLEGLPPLSIAAATALTALSYLALCGYDAISIRHLGVTRLSPRRIALTAFIAHAFSFMLGFGILSGGAVRLWLYGEAGVDAGKVAAMGVISVATFWLGLATLGGLALILTPTLATSLDDLPAWANASVGLALLAAILAAILWTSTAPRIVGRGDWRVTLPGWRPALAAIGVGAVDTAAAAGALYLLIPDALPGGYPAFVAVFALATAAGVLSHVPGGLGVFEAVILLALPAEPSADLVGALLAFRVLYYVMPFVVAVVLLGASQIAAGSLRLGGPSRALLRSIRPLAPRILALTVFLGGIVLLISGALPAEVERLRDLRHFVPLPFVETSHLLASIVGFVLLVVASGLLNRLATAWRLAVALLLAGSLFSLLKGFDYEEATICLAVAGLLIAARHEFYRRASLFDAVPPVDWIVAALVAIGASIWLGFFAYRHVDYSAELWWSFAYHGDAPRFMRATLAVAVAAVVFAVYRLVHRPPARARPDDEQSLAVIAPIVEASSRTDSQLAFLGDKSFLVNEAGTGFVMYAIEGRSFIAMGDPVSEDPAAVHELIWRFAELADREYAHAVFYQATTTYLPAYLDAGFSLVKLGEEAWVDLNAFTLEGSAGRKFRQQKARCEREELTVDYVTATDIDDVMADIKRVSDDWLGEKRGEKGFSLGFWSEPYVRRYDIAVVRHAGRIIAFANIWRAAKNTEFSVDLMRHAPEAPQGSMDALFIALMEKAKAEGYRWFNLGMTPLSGQPRHRLAPIWARVAGFIYRRGDRFYNFEGLRAFKEKFKPQWRPRYLAYRGSVTLPQVLFDATRLIAASRDRALDAQNIA